uniref:Serpentine receptor class gamma n=1 Tax=Panagrellus redivivus TaxID=6233 RepID=A0A7E4UUR1_PANRE
MWRSCTPPTPLFIVFYNVYMVTSVVVIVCMIMMAIMLSGVFLRGSSPLQSSYFRLVLVGCLVNTVIAVFYKTSATLTAVLPTITDDGDDYSLSLKVVGVCAWLTTFALSTSNFLFVLNRTTSLLCPVKHASIWTPATTFLLVLASVAVPFLADWNSLFHPCRLRLFTTKCKEFLLFDTLYSAGIAFTLSIISLCLAVLTLILTQKRASTVILKAEKHFIFQTIVASASLTGFSVTLWLSAYFMTIGQASWSCILSFVYEGCYLVYIFSNYISYFFTSPITTTGYLNVKFPTDVLAIHVENPKLVIEYYYFCIHEDLNPDPDYKQYDESLAIGSNITNRDEPLPSCPDEFVPIELNTKDELKKLYTYYLQARGILYLHYKPIRILNARLWYYDGTFEMYFPMVPKDISIYFVNAEQPEEKKTELTFSGVMVVVGIAVIFAIFAFMALALFAWYWCRRPKKKSITEEELNENILRQMAKAKIAYVDDDQNPPGSAEPVEKRPTSVEPMLPSMTCIESSTETPPETPMNYGSREMPSDTRIKTPEKQSPSQLTTKQPSPALVSPDTNTPITPNVSPVWSPPTIIIPPVPIEPFEGENYLGFAQRYGIITMDEYTTIANKFDLTMKHNIASMEAAVLDCPEEDVGVRRANTLVAEADGRLLAKGVKFHRGWNQVPAVWAHINDPRTPATDGYRFLLRALPGLFTIKKQSLRDPTVEAMPLCGIYILLLDLTLDLKFRERLFAKIRKRAAVLFSNSKATREFHHCPFPLPYLVVLQQKSPEMFKAPKPKPKQKEGILSSAEMFMRPIVRNL